MARLILKIYLLMERRLLVMNDTKFILLVVSFILVCLGLMWVWHQPAPCKEIQYQNLTGTHTGLDCSHG